ncbi:MAG: hypothetical protein HQK88_16660 [Nitrospirae bacterium]|nr:hypothetical protein [Nitrospirota bacterium]MBF0618432.1 hypothetical protein [Nitrospirota bacterium]
MAKSNLPTQNTPRIPTPLPPETIGQLVENQTKELELRAKELDFQKQQDNHNFEFSKKALDAQLEDRKMQRDHNKRRQHSLYYLIGFLALVIAIIVITSLYLNKETIASEIIKSIVYISAGGFGGYGIGKKKGKEQSSETDTSSF